MPNITSDKVGAWRRGLRSRVWIRNAAALMALSVLGGCAVFQTPSCPPGLRPMAEVQLFFGRNIAGGGQVGDGDWQRFVDQEVTPRFPGGFSVQDAVGQWRSGALIAREPSKLLTLVVADPGATDGKIQAIREAYKQRFHQESVLQTVYGVCGAF